MGQPEGKGDGPTGRSLRRRRVLVGDARDNGTYLRTTWHVEGHVFVVSTWNEEVCTAAVRVPVEGAAELASLLVDGLAEAARTPASEQPSPESPVEDGTRPKRPERGLRPLRRDLERGLLPLRHDLEAWVRHARGRLGDVISGRGGRRPAAPASPPASTPSPPTPTPPPPTASPPDEIRWTA